MGCGPSKLPSDPKKVVQNVEELDEGVEEEAYDSEVEAELTFDGVADARAEREEEPPKDELGGEDELGLGIEETQKEEFTSVKPWLGALCSPTDYQKPPEADGAPAQTLELEHVYGYRARDTRDNLFHTSDGCIVYPVAAVGVVYDPKTNTQKFFMGHDDDIVCLAYDKKNNVVATGQVGKKPKLCVWDATSTDLLAEFDNFHQRAIVTACFTANGDKVVSVGLDNNHSIAVYDWKNKAMVCNTKGDTARIFHVTCDPVNDAEFVTVGKNHMCFWDFSSGTFEKHKGIYGRMKRVTPLCATFVDAGVITGHANGHVYLWKKRFATSTTKIHDGAIYTIRAVDGATFISGGKEGTAKIIAVEGFEVQHTLDLKKVRSSAAKKVSVRAADVVDGKILAGGLNSQIVLMDTASGEQTVLMDGHHGDTMDRQSYGELWALSMHRSGNVFYTGGEDCTVRGWDMDEMKWKEIVNVGGKVRSVGLSPNSDLLAVGFVDGSLKVLDVADLNTVKWEKTDSKEAISQCVFSPDGTKLAVGSHDNRIYLYNSEDGSDRKICSGNSSFITHLDFSEDGKWLQSNSGSYELLFWDTETAQQNPNSSSLRDEKWATWTCTLGWPVQGIWPKYADGSDVNTVHRSNAGDIIATGEDSGYVKLFKYPCIGSGFSRRGKLSRRPHANKYGGHSEHVTNVFFSFDDSRVISLGGADLAILQWKVVE